MIGNDGSHVVLQERDRRLLSELRFMRFVDREQASIIAPFSSRSRASARLSLLTKAGHLRCTLHGTIHGGRRAIYSLPTSGGRISRRQVFASTSSARFLEHRFIVNAIYLLLKYKPIPDQGAKFRKWCWFQQPLSRTCPLIPDGYVDLNTSSGPLAMFLEVDLGTEALGVWRKKVQAYLDLAVSGEYERIFDHSRFRVLVIAHTKERAEAIRKVIGSATEKVFWIASQKSINGDGFWSAVWLRPTGGIPRSLLERK